MIRSGACCTALGKGGPIDERGRAMRRRFPIAVALCAGLAIAGCASRPETRLSGAEFRGAWSVRWCDTSAPDTDCGGFGVDLSQEGDRIRGGSFGARPGLSQIDEGGVIHGVVVGNTAVLSIESQRSGAIYLVQATVHGDCMRWTLRDTVRAPDGDIDIIALDDVLSRQRTMPANTPSVDCSGFPGMRNDRGRGE